MSIGAVFERTPVAAPISGKFGENYGGYLHRGVDFSCPVGTPVYAPADGYPVWCLNDGSFGVAVCLRHDQAPDQFMFSLYAHLDSRVVFENGPMVKAGDLLGYSGNTGKSTGPHLHWQLSSSPQFSVDISQSIDPMSRLGDSPMSPSEKAEFEALKQRIADLEMVLAGGIGGVGAAKMQGLNLLMGVNNNNQAIMTRIREHAGDGHGVPLIG